MSDGSSAQQQSKQQQQQGSDSQASDRPGSEAPDKSPSDVLRRLAERRRGAANRQQNAERIREMARELAQKSTPQERQRWAEQWQRQTGQNPPPNDRDSVQDHSSGNPDDALASGRRGGSDRKAPDRTAGLNDQLPPLSTDHPEDVDLRGDESGDQLIAQWLSDKPNGPQDQASHGDDQQRIHQAQDIAQRAVDDSAVQKHYHKVIKRYFGRLNQTVEKAHGGPPAPTAPPTTAP